MLAKYNVAFGVYMYYNFLQILSGEDSPTRKPDHIHVTAYQIDHPVKTRVTID